MEIQRGRSFRAGSRDADNRAERGALGGACVLNGSEIAVILPIVVFALEGIACVTLFFLGI